MSEAPVAKRMSLVAKFADKYTLEPANLLHTLKQTAFKQGQNDPPVSDEQMAALLVVADQYGLNPFTREIFAFADKYKGIVPVVSVDGWARIINEHPQFDGLEFITPETTAPVAHGGKQAFEWIETVIYRKDRNKPTRVKEYLEEVYQPPRGQNQTPGPWQSHPRRMHRHKSLIQCARLAFGFVGIYDDDEAQRIIDAQAIEGTAHRVPDERSSTARMRSALKPDEQKTPAAQEGGAGSPPAGTGTAETESAAPKKPTKEIVMLAIDGANTPDDLQGVLQTISQHDDEAEKRELMIAWNQRCVARVDGSKAAPAKEQVKTTETSKPPADDLLKSGEGDGKEKEAGTPQRFGSYVKKIMEAKTLVELEEIRTLIRSFRWTADQDFTLTENLDGKIAKLTPPRDC